MTALVPDLNADHWGRLRYDIEAEYWNIQRKRQPQLEFIREMANQLAENPDLLVNSLGGEWDFRSPITFRHGRVFMEHPLSICLRAVCRRELEGYEWEIFEPTGGTPTVVIQERVLIPDPF